jgi:hypothetical protein
MGSVLKTKNILAAAFIVETFCITYALSLNAWMPFISILYFICGIVISILILLLPEAKQYFFVKEKTHYFPTLSLRIVITIIMAVQAVYFTAKWVEDAPIDFHDADMLPVIHVMAGRFVAGNFSHIYDIIPDIWNGMRPVYLPAMWLPFSVSVIGNFDMRWVTCALLIASFTIFIFIFHPSHQKKVSPYILGAAFMLFWWLSTSENNGLIPYTEEGIVIFYYVLLTVSLLNRNILLIAITTTLCALSRYSFIGWVLPFGVILIYEKKINKFYKWAATIFVLGLLMTVIPFGWKPFYNLLSLPGQYVDFAARVWHDGPHVFYQNPGMAKFFGPHNIRLQHKLLISLSFAVPLLFVMIAFWLRDVKKYNIHNVFLATFKLSLVIFYNFIDVPYLYLFYTSSFVSLIIVGYFVSRYPKDLVARY